MKRTIVLFSLLALLAIPARAQTNSGLTHVWQDVKTFLSGTNSQAFNSTNWLFDLGANYNASKVGFSAEAAYPLNDHVSTGLALDYIHGSWYEASVQTTIGTTFNWWGVDIHPYGKVAVGYCLDGPTSGDAVGIAGGGGKISLDALLKRVAFIKSLLGDSAHLNLSGEMDHYSNLTKPVYKGFLELSITFK